MRDFDGSGGAIHCITKQIPADNPVRILHKSIVGPANDMRGSDIPVSAIITNRSGIAHAECIYRIDGGQWNTLSLNGNGNKFSALIPTASINERIIDTIITPGMDIDSTVASTDTIVSYNYTFSHIDSLTLDSVFTVDTVYSYINTYNYDTTYYNDTTTALRDTLITFEYYISATSNNGKTITKPMTAHQGGYYHFTYNGELEEPDSMKYDFSTDPRPATDITFVFDANRNYLDTNAAPGSSLTGIASAQPEAGFGQFYPNPATHQAKIEIDLGNGGSYAVDIIDNLGRTVHSTHLETAGSILFTINTDRLPAGIYSVRFSSHGTNVVRRLVVR